MKVDVLLGLQWGDEGKGKIVDVLTPKYDIIARFQGGPNAGHTLKFSGKTYVLHLIPSGIFRENTLNIIGNGVVLDPVIFKQEINGLSESGMSLYNKILIANKTHLILPTHRELDAASEAAKGLSKIGSTLKGIGPAYMDKTGRNGLRVGDILSKNFKEKYELLKEKHFKLLQNFDFKYDISEYEKKWFEGIEELKKFQFIDCEHYINDALIAGKKILAEGAQGTLLDIDFGSYPFVTSSNTVSSGACTGLGIAPGKVGEVFGIFKAYCTRVGSGPFPTELFDSCGEKMQKIGNEFGATTGRTRRCGWLDLVALKYAVQINGVTQLIMSKADVLDGFETIKVAVEYIIDGKKTDKYPFEIHSEIDLVYKEFEGWQTNLSIFDSFEKLPENVVKYISFIEEEVGVPVKILSTGPDRDQIILK